MDLEVAGTKVTFLAYPYGLVEPLIIEGSVSLAAPREIGLSKAHALGRRLAARDYIDLYYLFRSREVTLRYIEEEGRTKFVLPDGTRTFDYHQFLRQLADPSDIDDWDEALSQVRDPQLSARALSESFEALTARIR